MEASEDGEVKVKRVSRAARCHMRGSLAHLQSEVMIGAKQQAIPLIHRKQLFNRLYAFALE